MIDAEVLATPPYSSEEPVALCVYSTWIPRGGDNVRVAIEVLANSFTKMTVQVFHKNRSEVGDGTAFTPSTSVVFEPATGRQVEEWSGLKELVRFHICVEADGGGEVIEDGTVGWVIFRFLLPAWFEAVKA